MGLILWAVLIGTAFAATLNGSTGDLTQRSEIRNYIADHIGENEDWWKEMEEHMNNQWDEIEDH